MKTLKFLAVAFLFLAVGFFMVGCFGSDAKLRLQIRQDIKDGVGPLTNEVALLKKNQPDLRPFQGQLNDNTDRITILEATVANLQQGITVAVQTSAAAKGEANRAGEVAAATLKKATDLEKKFQKILASAASISQLKQELGLQAFVKGEQIHALHLKSGSSEISEKQQMDQIAQMKKHGLVVKDIIGIRDRKLPKADNEDAAVEKNKELADKRVANAVSTFHEFLAKDFTTRTSSAPPSLPDISGVVLVLGKPT